MTMESKDFRKLLSKIKGKKELSFIDVLHSKFPKATVYLVGGATRDIVAGNLKSKIPNLKSLATEDLDFVVEGIGRDELEKFLEQNGTVKDVESRAFGVFIFVPKGGKEAFDVALPRDEHWMGESYKDIEVKTEGLTIKEDLSRRDFTINAMAINLKNAELIDEFNGQKDLKKKIIKTVGEPEKRFMEDPSRILRGVRFSVELDFKTERKTLEAMKRLVGEIRKPIEENRYRVAEEIIAKEFLKAFDKNPIKTVKLYDAMGLLEKLLPEVRAMQGVKQPDNFHSEGDVYQHTLIALEKLKEARPVISSKEIKYSINLKLATLFHDIGKPATFTPPQNENDRIHFNEHDEVGVKIAKRVIRRLKLTSLPKKSELHINKKIVSFLVRKHMILITAKPEEMKLTTFEKYFFREDDVGDELLMLSWADISATIPPSGIPDFSIYNAFVKKIKEIREVMKARKTARTLPPSLINGHEVMKVLKIKSGIKVGVILKKIREMQIQGLIKNKKEALKKIRELKKNS